MDVKKTILLTFLVLLVMGGFGLRFIFKQVLNRQPMEANRLYQKEIVSIKVMYQETDDRDNYQLALTESNNWQVIINNKTKPADANVVKRMIKSATSPAKLKITAVNPKFLDRFLLDEANRTEMDWQTKTGETIKLYVGKMGPDFQSTYVSFDPEGPVLVLEEVDRFTLLPSDPVLYTPFRDLNLDESQVNLIEATASAKTVRLEHSPQGEWRDQTGLILKAEKVTGWLDKLNRVRGESVELVDDINLDSKPEWELKLKLDDKQINARINREAKKEAYWLSTSARPDYLWRVSRGVLTDLIIKPSDWVDSTATESAKGVSSTP